MSKHLTSLTALVLLALFFFPVIAGAQTFEPNEPGGEEGVFEPPESSIGDERTAPTEGDGLVPCNGPDCGFYDLVTLVNNILTFVLYVAFPLAAIMFAWAGFLYITAGGSQDKISSAHSIFRKVGLGFVLILGAWLLVNLILIGLTGEGLEDFLPEE